MFALNAYKDNRQSILALLNLEALNAVSISETNYGHLDINYDCSEMIYCLLNINYGRLEMKYGRLDINYGWSEINYCPLEMNYGSLDAKYGRIEKHYDIFEATPSFLKESVGRRIIF